MALKVTRALFVLSCLLMGLIWTNFALDFIAQDQAVPLSDGSRNLWYVFGAAAGASVAVVILLALRFVTQEVFERLFPVVIAIVLSIFTGYGVAKYMEFLWPIRDGNEADVMRHVYLTSTLVLLFGFIGISLGLTKASSWESLVSVVRKRHIEFGSPKIVDTSVLIDGRIKDIIDSRFLEGTLIIPRFVLKELQHIADSADVLRRTKGRRGLDILRDLQDPNSGIDVEIVNDNPPDLEEVDEKIVSIAKDYSARILTTDYNLNKVAQIEGIDVLNINDLANALKPAALPDESLDVKIIKEGKEADQGVGYLDDGTMIVVDGGRSFVGKRVSVTVTSVLQTAAGRMIFTKVASGSGTQEPARQAL